MAGRRGILASRLALSLASVSVFVSSPPRNCCSGLSSLLPHLFLFIEEDWDVNIDVIVMAECCLSRCRKGCEGGRAASGSLCSYFLYLGGRETLQLRFNDSAKPRLICTLKNVSFSLLLFLRQTNLSSGRKQNCSLDILFVSLNPP